jgi:hypothetical protein
MTAPQAHQPPVSEPQRPRAAADAGVGSDPLPDGARLIVGVTAHRDPLPASVPQLEAVVTAHLQRLRALHPDLPLAVMSALAEGGDRLVARCALALGIPLIAPLALPLDDYLADFESAESRAEFHALLAHAQVVELPLAVGNTLQSVRSRGPARDRQYAQLGVYVSSHCQLLLALWDGKPGEAAGGTAAVVGYHLHGEMAGLDGEDVPPNLLADDDSDLVLHIVCARDRVDGEVAQAGSTYWLTRSAELPGDGPLPDSYQRLFRQLGEFNADARKYAERIAADAHSLLPTEGEIALAPVVHAIDAMYARADWLAMHFRERVHQGLLLVHVLAVLTGLLLMVYSEFDAGRSLIAGVLVLFALGVAVVRLGERREWHRRYLDYRVLAEGLRVQCYWSIAGVPAAHRVRFTYDSFLQKQDVELGWIRHAMRAVNIGGGGAPSGSDAGLHWVVQHWVGDGGPVGQLGYFRRRSADRERKYRHTEAIGRASLLLSLGSALTLLLAAAMLPPHAGRWLLVLTGVAALFAGVRAAYSHKLADKELIKQYRFMSRVFAGAAQRLAADSTPLAQRKVLEALGDAALEEHAEWILMHRERPLEANRIG